MTRGFFPALPALVLLGVMTVLAGSGLGMTAMADPFLDMQAMPRASG